MIISFCLYSVILYFFSRLLLFPEEGCCYNVEVLLNVIRQKSSLFDGTIVLALWIKNYPTHAASTNKKEKEQNHPQSQTYLFSWFQKPLFKNGKRGIGR